MRRDNIYIKAAVETVAVLAVAMAVCAVIGALCGCTRKIYVPVESVRTERLEADTAKFMALVNSLKEQVSQRESVKESLIHNEKETVKLNENGDTIFRDRFIYINLQSEEKKEYEHKIESLRDSISDLRSQLESVKVDSIPVPYPVERPLSKWEKVKMEAGGWAIGAGSALLVAVTALLIWLIRIRRRR